MSISNITVNNGSVDVTYSCNGQEGLKSTYLAAGATFKEQPLMLIRGKSYTNSSTSRRGDAQCQAYYAVTQNSLVTYCPVTVKVEWSCDVHLTAAQIKMIRMTMSSLLANSVMENAIDKGIMPA